MKKQKGSGDNLSESLVEETLQEAADRFFGQRVDIERAVSLYEKNVEKLRQVYKSVSICQTNLHFLLCRGRRECVEGFYREIGVDPSQVPEPDSEAKKDFDQLPVPFGLFQKTRYTKWVRAAYVQFATSAHDYMHGRYYNDPEDPRRKRVTVHYHQLEGFCREVNERIQKANQYNSPTQMMQFFKQFDIEGSEKEDLVGVPLHYNLDQEMAFSALDMSCSYLPAYPEFPSEKKIGRVITTYCARIFRQFPEEIRSLFV